MFQANVKLDLRGLKPLVRRIKELESKRTRARVVRNGLNAGARVIRKQMKANAPKRTGGLKKSIAVKTVVSGTTTSGYSLIGPSWPAGAHAHFTEFGTTLRATKGKRGHSTGFVRGTRWMTRAFETSEAKAIDAIADRITEELIKAVSIG